MNRQKAVVTKKKKIILTVLLSIAGALTAAAVIFGVHVYRVLTNPSSFFKPAETGTDTDADSLPIEPAFTIDTDKEPDASETDAETKPPETDVPGVKAV